MYKARFVINRQHVSRYMHDPGRGHWKTVKEILWFIRSTIDVELIFEKDANDKQQCTGYDDFDYILDFMKYLANFAFFSPATCHRRAHNPVLSTVRKLGRVGYDSTSSV